MKTKTLLLILLTLIVWPCTSQNEGKPAKPDSLKLAYKDAESAALELEEKDRLEAEKEALEKTIKSYQAETLEQQIQRAALSAQLELQKKINRTQKTQITVLEEKGKKKFGFTEALIGLTLFFLGTLVAG